MRQAAFVLMALLASAGAGHAAECDFQVSDYVPCTFSRIGSDPAEALSARHQQFIRVFLAKNAPTIVIELMRPANGAAYLIVRDPNRRYPPLVVGIPDDLWQGFSARWQSLDRANTEQQRRRAAEEEAGMERVCLHPWIVTGQSNIPGTATSQLGDSCGDEPIVDFAWDIAKQALTAAPPCDLLDENLFRLAPWRLEVCLQLSGERRSAALTANAATRFSYDNANLALFFTPDATLALSDAPPIRGLAAVLSAWTSILSGTSYPNQEIQTITGHGDHAVVTGVVEQTLHQTPSARVEQARFEAIWRRQPDGTFKLQSLAVSRFVPVPRR